ncbi:ABC transporter permease [Paenibacillus sp. BIHB 4019]|uniref:ABC transporter permease n=1 Tax=Paenibacillus sp. BIHB 4019 TaxID=1870819 RepID=A0A1B2DR91_9BACL|nr:ABC-2 family transporter protein [Paenibacillus sp. BIHB 4019]ANY70218.1 ABC transporter permease [Paenibacillus sp. BIHB 4019]
MLKTLKKYALIYKVFVKNCFIAQMEYRINFLFANTIEIAYLFIKLLYVMVAFRVGVVINGYTPDMMMMFVGSFTMMTGFYCLFFYSNFMNLSNHVRNGTLDLLITKPVSLQFIATLRNVDFGFSFTNVVAGAGMIILAWSRMGIPVTFSRVVMFLLFIFLGIVLKYAIFLMPSLISFWTVQTAAVNQMSTAIWDMNHVPMHIYGRSVRHVGTFLFPVFVITNFPPLFVLDRLGWVHMVWFLFAPLLFLFLSRKLWNVAIRNYSSASS